jgi:hypothetical protein
VWGGGWLGNHKSALLEKLNKLKIYLLIAAVN